MNCVTPSGDQVNAKGALTGGYYDPRFSRIKAMKAIKRLREQLKEEMQQVAKLKTRIEGLILVSNQETYSCNMTCLLNLKRTYFRVGSKDHSVHQ
jgi:structural maintenance of chromosome 3 (chondroitin sulfate proteoglycan 6)